MTHRTASWLRRQGCPLALALLSMASPLRAATFPEFVDPNPVAGNGFGTTVVALGTGNVVITSHSDDAGGSNAGAVYLFNGATGALISTLRGSTANDNVGSGGVVALADGNYVVVSPFWDNPLGFANIGAVTWGSGTTGVSGVVSSANSLVGTITSDQVGSSGVKALSNGNYVVVSPLWDNVFSNVGAVTWGSGTTGVSGAVSAANSLVGSTSSDQVGSSGVTVLSNGNYVVSSSGWDDGATFGAGAVTWGNGATGVFGAVSAVNSLVGSTLNDNVGGNGVTALSNGNYVVRSPAWDQGIVANVGAATWGSGTTGVNGVVSAANSLVGSTAFDQVSGSGVTALSNDNYVVTSQNWDNGAIADAGAATWGSGTTGVIGAVSAVNSLVGSTVADLVGVSGVTALTNGNYVVRSTLWDNGAVVNAGAATWGSGTTGVNGAVSAVNSLVGSAPNDEVGGAAVALAKGNYVVSSPNWNNGGVIDAGAVTWGSGTTGVSGVVSAANSLVGSTSADNVGSGLTALTNGNYVVRSSNWDNVAVANAGAMTWGNGTTGLTGVVSATNSLVGSTASDNVGNSGVTALSNGNYVVGSQNWDNGAVVNAGAATWGSGTTGVTGVVSAANTLVGSTAFDQVGGSGVTALSNGSYVVRSSVWDNGAIVDAGAATWGSGTTGVSGAVSAANSLVGSTAGDNVGGTAISALPNGNYLVVSASWDSVPLAGAGAATWGSGLTGISGAVSGANSLIGKATSAGLQSAVTIDSVNATFSARFTADGGGRVRVGQQESDRPVIAGIADVRNDQGRQVRLSFMRSGSDVLGRGAPITGYHIYRREIVTQAARSSEGPRGGATPQQALIAGWDYLMTLPASTDDAYQLVVPTLADSSETGFHRTVLFVRAATATPGVHYDSAPDSGWSADNLPPAPPAPFVAAFTAAATHLHWGRNGEPDLWYYAIYRGASADFVPGPSNRIGTRSDTGYVDAGPAGSYYKISAVDVNGNESGFALVTPTQTTGVPDGGAVAFALEGARPNPAGRNSLRVAFALPSGEAARLELVDVSGRRVRSREVGSLGVGRHTVNLADGRRVAPGLYWVRLTQGPNQRTARVVVVE